MGDFGRYDWDMYNGKGAVEKGVTEGKETSKVPDEGNEELLDSRSRLLVHEHCTGIRFTPRDGLCRLSPYDASS
jgi:hypothetical protein